MTPTVIRSQLHNSSNNNNNCQSSSASPVVVMVSNTNSKKLGNLPESGLSPSTVGALSSSSQQLSSNKGMVQNPETTTVSKSDRTDVSNNLNCVSDASWNNMSSSLKVTEERNKVLMNVCFKTLELTAKNRQLQKELADLKEQTKAFVDSIKATQGAQTTSGTLMGITTTLSSTLSTSTQVPKMLPIQLSQLQGTPLLLANGNQLQLNPLFLNLGYLNPALYNNPLVLKALGVMGGLNNNNTNNSSPQISQSLSSTATVAPQGLDPLKPTAAVRTVQSQNPVPTINSTGTTIIKKEMGAEKRKLEPICSCCANDVLVESGSEDTGKSSSNVQNYYQELNGMAQRWVNTLLSTSKSLSPPSSPASSTRSYSASNEAYNNDSLQRMKAKTKQFKTISSIEKSEQMFDTDSSASSCSSSSPFLSSSSSFKRKRFAEQSGGGSHKRLKSSRLRLSSPTNSEASSISSFGVSSLPLFGTSLDDDNGFDSIPVLGSPDELSTMTDQELFQQSPPSSSNDSIESS